jgi:branched-chain amino acid transport system permease protein
VTAVDLALAGLGVGAIAALAGLGLLVTYRVTGVFNLAFGAIAALAAELLRHAVREWGLPTLPSAVAIVVVVCPALGVLVSALVFRPLERRRAGTAESLVASLGVFVVVVGLIAVVWGTQSWPDAPALFSARSVSLPFDLTVRRDSLGALVIVAVVGVGLALLLRTRAGLTARAVVEDRDLAELTAIDTDRVSMAAWAGGFALAGLAGILIAPSVRLDPYGLTLVVLGTMSVAVIARLSSPLVAVAAALVIGIAQSELTQWHPTGRLGVLVQALSSNLYAVALLLALLFMRHLAEDRGQSITARLARRHDLRPPTGWWIPALVVLGAPLMLSGPDLRDAQQVPALAVIFLSIVVVTGYTGQISLGQAGFAGLGALLAGHLVHDGIGPVPAMPALVAALVAALLTGLLGSLIARPAIRRRGLFLALTTFAVGSIISRFVFAQPTFVGGVRIGLPPPFTGDKAFYVLELLVLGVALLVVRNHHQGRLGRALLAVRDDEPGAEAVGVDSHRLRIWAFAVSTGLAAIGGVLLASSQRSFDASTFDPIQSLIWFAAVMVFGIDSAMGAVLGAALLVALDVEVGNGVSTLVIGVAAVLLGRLPGGLMYLSRRAVARALAFLRTGPRPVELPPVRLSPAGRALAARVQAARGTR